MLLFRGVSCLIFLRKPFQRLFFCEILFFLGECVYWDHGMQCQWSSWWSESLWVQATNILLMVKILQRLRCMKSYESWDENYLSAGAGFRPSTHKRMRSRDLFMISCSLWVAKTMVNNWRSSVVIFHPATVVFWFMFNASRILCSNKDMKPKQGGFHITNPRNFNVKRAHHSQPWKPWNCR